MNNISIIIIKSSCSSSTLNRAGIIYSVLSFVYVPASSWKLEQKR